MPNNASARRVKDKKNKDKKGKGDKRTDTLSLPKENTAGVDSGTLSLSSAGQDKSSTGTKESNSLSPSAAGREQARQGSCLALYERALNRAGAQDLLLFLHQMEGHIAKHAQDEDDSWAAALMFEYTLSTSIEERLDLSKAFRDKCRLDNPLISREELKALLEKERLRNMLEWRRGVLQGEKDFLLSSALSERIKDDELLVRGPAQDALLKEYSLSLTLEESVNTYAGRILKQGQRSLQKSLGQPRFRQRLRGTRTKCKMERPPLFHVPK